MAIVCALVGAGPAGAQTPDPQGGGTPRPEASRPYRGLFGSGQNPASAHTLILAGSAYGGRDDNVLADQPGIGIGPSPDQREAGTLYGGSLSLDYGKHGRRVDFGLSVNSGTRVYPDQRDLTAGSYGFGAGISSRLSRRATLRLSQNASYQPFYQLSFFPGVGDPVLGEGVPSNLDLVVSSDSGWLFGTSASYGYQLGARTNLSLEYNLNKSKFDLKENSAAAGQRDLDNQSGGFRLSRSLTRHASLRLGYIYRRGSYSGTPTPGVPNLIEGHDIDAGVDYARDLSLFRRTRFSFGTGSSLLRTGGRTFYRFLGNAALHHEITRTWYASLRYNRDVGFAGSFPEPIFSDNLALTINGFLGPRVNVSFGGGLSTGDIGADVRESVTPNRDTAFTTYTANASVQYAMSANLALFASYSYFSYDFPLDPLLPVVGNQSRNGIRGGLSFSLPLLR